MHFIFIETCLFVPSIPIDFQITEMGGDKFVAENGHGEKLEGRVSRRQVLKVTATRRTSPRCQKPASSVIAAPPKVRLYPLG